MEALSLWRAGWLLWAGPLEPLSTGTEQGRRVRGVLPASPSHAASLDSGFGTARNSPLSQNDPSPLCVSACRLGLGCQTRPLAQVSKSHRQHVHYAHQAGAATFIPLPAAQITGFHSTWGAQALALAWSPSTLGPRWVATWSTSWEVH